MQTAIAGGVTRSPFDAGMPERILAGGSDPLTEVMRAWAGGALGGAISGVGALPGAAQRAGLLSRLALEDFERWRHPRCGRATHRREPEGTLSIVILATTPGPL